MSKVVATLLHIQNKIYLIRSFRVMLASDLARLYGVSAKRLNEQVRRNLRRFPPDFMVRLSWEEAHSLRSQNATLEKSGRGRYPKYRPTAFTEQGVAMLSSVLNSQRAIDVNITIMRAFVRLREMINKHKDLAHKLDELERKVNMHDGHIRLIFQSMRALLNPPLQKKISIGFKACAK
ncbi:MAG: ORF6N domain-containing protein [Elusimicrobia bacterium]|nr:ORF6N domain-containing protein [Candidatus Obscuribacterium magneticum]